jgi:ferredoxin
MADMRAALRAIGLSNIRTELFGAKAGHTPGIAATDTPAPHPPPGPAGTGPSVSFARSGLTVPWSDEHGSLLALAEACDVPTGWVCRTGVCHTCVTALASGTVAYQPKPLVPPAGGSALICCARPTADVVLDL